MNCFMYPFDFLGESGNLKNTTCTFIVPNFLTLATEDIKYGLSQVLAFAGL